MAKKEQKKQEQRKTWEKGHHPGGRPTKYRDEYCQRIIDYFIVEPQQTTYKRTYYADGTLKSEDPITLAEQIPTFQGFAQSIDVTMTSLQEWCAEHSEFSTAYARAKSLQEKIWLINGMSGLYNSQFAQFFGKNCLGYKDRQEVAAEVTARVSVEDIIKKAEGEEY